MNRLVVTIPMKSASRAKSRLSGALSPARRALLAEQLYVQTLAFFAEHYPQLPLAVVTDCDRIAALARDAGARVLRDVGGGGLNGALALATAANIAQGFSAQLVVPADIAHLATAEFDQLLSAASGRRVVIAQATDLGTNALLTEPPDLIAPAFGLHSSLAHAARAVRAGVVPTVLQLAHLSHDVDRPSDLLRLPTGSAGGAPALEFAP